MEVILQHIISGFNTYGEMSEIMFVASFIIFQAMEAED